MYIYIYIVFHLKGKSPPGDLKPTGKAHGTVAKMRNT